MNGPVEVRFERYEIQNESTASRYVLVAASDLFGGYQLVCFRDSVTVWFTFVFLYTFNPLKPELNPICYLLALLGAHHFLHVSRIRVKLLTLR